MSTHPWGIAVASLHWGRVRGGALNTLLPLIWNDPLQVWSTKQCSAEFSKVIKDASGAIRGLAVRLPTGGEKNFIALKNQNF